MTTEQSTLESSGRMSSLEGIRIFDCHGHLGPCRSFHMVEDGSPESMIAVMNTCGIERIVVSSMLSLYYDVPEGNREMIDIVTRFPERFLGYVSIAPDMNQKAQIDELELYRGRSGIAGVKIHPGLHESRPADPGYEPTYRWCAEYGYPLLSHTWGEADIADFGGILKRIPELKLVIGHSGGPYRGALQRACDLAAKSADVYLDITCSQALAGLIEWMIVRAPVERILFGSDTPFIDPRPAIGLVAFSEINDAAKEAIFLGNATRLFGSR